MKGGKGNKMESWCLIREDWMHEKGGHDKER